MRHGNRNQWVLRSMFVLRHDRWSRYRVMRVTWQRGCRWNSRIQPMTLNCLLTDVRLVVPIATRKRSKKRATFFCSVSGEVTVPKRLCVTLWSNKDCSCEVKPRWHGKKRNHRPGGVLHERHDYRSVSIQNTQSAPLSGDNLQSSVCVEKTHTDTADEGVSK